MHTKLLYINYS